MQINYNPVYYSQRDNQLKPHSTCNSSSNAMLLSTLKPTVLEDRLNADSDYTNRVLWGDFGRKGYRNASIYHDVQTNALKHFGIDSRWCVDRDFDKVLSVLPYQPVVVNILHKGYITKPYGGHVIVIVGYTDNRLDIYDPWDRDLDYISGRYINNTKGIYNVSTRSFLRRWQGGYRVVDKVNGNDFPIIYAD